MKPSSSADQIQNVDDEIICFTPTHNVNKSSAIDFLDDSTPCTTVPLSPRRRVMPTPFTHKSHEKNKKHSDTPFISSPLFSLTRSIVDSQTSVSNITPTFQQFAADMGVAYLLPKFKAGYKLQIVLRDQEIAAVLQAKLVLDEKNNFPLLFLESCSRKCRRRALLIDKEILASVEPTSAKFLHGAKCKKGSEYIINQLVDGFYKDKDSKRKKNELFYVTIPIRNTYSGYIVFLLANEAEVTDIMGLTALFQSYYVEHDYVF